MQVAESLGDCGDVRWVKQLAQHSDHDAEHGECRTLEQHEQSNATLCKRPSSNSDERPAPPSRPRGKPRVIATEQLCGIARATAVDKLTPMACSYSPHIGALCRCLATSPYSYRSRALQWTDSAPMWRECELTSQCAAVRESLMGRMAYTAVQLSVVKYHDIHSFGSVILESEVLMSGTSGVDDGGKNTLQLRYALIG